LATIVAASVLLTGCSRGQTRAADPEPLPSTTLGASTSTAPPTTTALPPCEGSGTVAHRNIAYDHIDGVDANLLSLDVYEPKLGADCPAPPIMIYVHGGAWAIGNKTSNVRDKVTWFNEMGWVFVSVNYRLSPVDSKTLDPDRVMYPTHNDDVANAVAWVHDHAADYGANADAISIMGHSAGAGIVAALATDEHYLEGVGLALSSIRCAVPLDTAAWDITERATNPSAFDLYINAFGDDPAVWKDASPIEHVAAGKDIPAFFIVTRGSAYRVGLAGGFADALTAAGVTTELLEATGLDHEGVNQAIGAPNDALISPPLGRFLNDCR